MGRMKGLKSRWAMKLYRHIGMEKKESALEYHSEFKLDSVEGDSLQSTNEMGFSSKNTKCPCRKEDVFQTSVPRNGSNAYERLKKTSRTVRRSRP